MGAIKDFKLDFLMAISDWKEVTNTNCSISGRENKGVKYGLPRERRRSLCINASMTGRIERELMSGDELDLNTRKPVLLSTFMFLIASPTFV